VGWQNHSVRGESPTRLGCMTTSNNTIEKQAARETRYGPIDANALNLPNCITVSRLVLAFVLFGMISYGGRSLVSTASVETTGVDVIVDDRRRGAAEGPTHRASGPRRGACGRGTKSPLPKSERCGRRVELPLLRLHPRH
jgi:hypothetical protein